MSCGSARRRDRGRPLAALAIPFDGLVEHHGRQPEAGVFLDVEASRAFSSSAISAASAARDEPSICSRICCSRPSTWFNSPRRESSSAISSARCLELVGQPVGVERQGCLPERLGASCPQSSWICSPSTLSRSRSSLAAPIAPRPRAARPLWCSSPRGKAPPVVDPLPRATLPPSRDWPVGVALLDQAVAAGGPPRRPGTGGAVPPQPAPRTVSRRIVRDQFGGDPAAHVLQVPARTVRPRAAAPPSGLDVARLLDPGLKIGGLAHQVECLLGRSSAVEAQRDDDGSPFGAPGVQASFTREPRPAPRRSAAAACSRPRRACSAGPRFPRVA